MTDDQDNGTEEPKADFGLPQIGELLKLVGVLNPITPVVTTMDQMRRGAEALVSTLETLQQTLVQLNATAERMNRLLDDVETPLRITSDAMRQMAPLIQAAGPLNALSALRNLFPQTSSGSPETKDSSDPK
jgi:uncharacterized protein YukE